MKSINYMITTIVITIIFSIVAYNYGHKDGFNEAVVKETQEKAESKIGLYEVQSYGDVTTWNPNQDRLKFREYSLKSVRHKDANHFISYRSYKPEDMPLVSGTKVLLDYDGGYSNGSENNQIEYLYDMDYHLSIKSVSH